MKGQRNRKRQRQRQKRGETERERERERETKEEERTDNNCLPWKRGGEQATTVRPQKGGSTPDCTYLGNVHVYILTEEQSRRFAAHVESAQR